MPTRIIITIQTKQDNPAKQEGPNKYIEWVQKLRDVIVAKSQRTASFRRSSWEKEFRLLEKQLGVHHSQLVPTLEWYCRNIGRQYVPVCLSARSFRFKYDSIRAAMGRIVDSVQVDPAKVDKVMKAIIHLGWKSDIRTAVSQSIHYLEEFQNRLRSNKNNIEEGLYSALRNIFFEESFLYHWFTKVHYKKKLQISSEFRTDEVFNPQSKLVDEFGIRAVQQWYGYDAMQSYNRWKELRVKISW